MSVAEQLCAAIRRYQTSDYVHPLTCVESEHRPLVPFVYEDECKLLCPDCGEITRPPKLDFLKILEDVTKSFASLT